MRILQVIHDYVISSRAGSEIYTYYLSKELSKNHEVALFFTIPENGDKGKVVQGYYDGIPYWALKKNRILYSHPFQDRNKWVEKEFNKVITQFNPDLIHFQHLIDLSLSLPSVAKKRGIPSCLTLHDFWFICPRIFFLNSEQEICNNYYPGKCLDCLEEEIGYYPTQSTDNGLWFLLKREAKRLLNLQRKAITLFSLALWRPYWVKKVFKDVDYFIAPSRFLQEKYLQQGMPRSKITFMRYGFNKDNYHKIKKRKLSNLRFGFVGTINPHKGVYLLIEAFNNVLGSAELKIYGRVPSQRMDDLKERIKNSNIHLMGEIKEEDKKKVFSEIDLLIVPSIWYENCPLVINEAFMAKTPVIASEIGGMLELVKDGKNGFTFPVGDSGKLTEIIELCIRNPKLIEKLSKNTTEVKDIKNHTEEIMKIYDQLKGK